MILEKYFGSKIADFKIMFPPIECPIPILFFVLIDLIKSSWNGIQFLSFKFDCFLYRSSKK